MSGVPGRGRGVINGEIGSEADVTTCPEKVVCITGMHRSGTSLVGAATGSASRAPSQEWNVPRLKAQMSSALLASRLWLGSVPT